MINIIIYDLRTCLKEVVAVVIIFILFYTCKREKKLIIKCLIKVCRGYNVFFFTVANKLFSDWWTECEERKNITVDYIDIQIVKKIDKNLKYLWERIELLFEYYFSSYWKCMKFIEFSIVFVVVI